MRAPGRSRRSRKDVRVLISTDAGGEGLNLQFCHVIVNFDMPWNPMRIEQRIGRVDRIGQPHVVRAINFVLEDTVEHRVREVLEEKLAVIAEEFGVDKASDVMDSVEAEPMFDELFVHGLQNPDAIEQECDAVVSQLRSTWRSRRRTASCCPRARAGRRRRPQVARPPGAVLAGARHHHRVACARRLGVKVGDAWRVKWADGSESATGLL
jgi:superfamily II DNA/RNA helicase